MPGLVRGDMPAPSRLVAEVLMPLPPFVMLFRVPPVPPRVGEVVDPGSLRCWLVLAAGEHIDQTVPG